jgi:molecular chaperone DnaK
MKRAVGIDLGTTFSSITIVNADNVAHPIPNAEGMFTTPSVALWRDGRFIVGQPALDSVQAASGEERERLTGALIRGVKRMMGRPPVGGLVSNGYRTDPIEVSAAILAKLVHDASLLLGFPVRDTVITVPAHFGDRERSATKAAAERAGLRVLQMINEPSAAALTYTHGQQVEPGAALVFDLGGGTFDATILQLGTQGSRVLATKGIEELGGINFTNALATFLRRRYEMETKTAYPNDSAAYDQLVNVAEAAKCRLSAAQSTRVMLAPPHSVPLELEVTRKQFEGLIGLLLLQLQVVVEQTLERAHKTPSDIQRVLLCGGSSRIPAVQEMLKRFFGRLPETTLDLDLSVALGAAYQAAAYAEVQREEPGQNGKRQDALQHAPALQLLAEVGLVIDCVSYPVGIAVKNARGESVKLVMLRPGDALNAWSQPVPVRILGSTATFPPIDVYAGDGTQLLAKDYLGQISLALPPGTPSGAHATVMMRQDGSGLVQIQINLAGRDLPGNLQRI